MRSPRECHDTPPEDNFDPQIADYLRPLELIGQGRRCEGTSSRRDVVRPSATAASPQKQSENSFL
jgi:hypothetical protein